MKRAVLMLSLLTVAAAGAAQPVTNFQITDSISSTLTGGETERIQTTLDNTAGKAVPLVIEITTTSPEGMSDTGNEFSFTSSIAPEQTNTTYAQTCSYQADDNAVDNQTAVYTCTSGQQELQPRLQNTARRHTVTLDATASLAIKPGRYNISANFKSTPGVKGTENKTQVTKDTPTTVKSGSTEVNITAQDDANASVAEYEDLSVSPPENDRSFVSGVEVEVTDKNGSAVEANGTVTVTYNQSEVAGLDETSLQVYVYNETSQSWETDGISVINRDTQQNTITATAPHFSLYATFGQQQPSSSTSDTGGGGGAISYPSCRASDWDCSAWSECTDGTQTRTCETTNLCNEETGFTPDETRSCTTEPDTQDNETQETDTSEPDQDSDPEPDTGDESTPDQNQDTAQQERDQTPPATGLITATNTLYTSAVALILGTLAYLGYRSDRIRELFT